MACLSASNRASGVVVFCNAVSLMKAVGLRPRFRAAAAMALFSVAVRRIEVVAEAMRYICSAQRRLSTPTLPGPSRQHRRFVMLHSVGISDPAHPENPRGGNPRWIWFGDPSNRGGAAGIERQLSRIKT